MGKNKNEPCKKCGTLFACQECSDRFVEIDKELWEAQYDKNEN